jgi:MFS family permease
MLAHYLALEGPESAIGRLAGALERFAGSDPQGVQTLFGGVLGALYSLLQFLFAPVWGALSDRIGRRPTLLVTLFGTLLSYLLWALAGSFWLLVVARCLGGCMAGNISTASAVVADTTRAEKRAGGMGIVGMAIGLGFVLGPALGAAAFELGGFEPAVWRRGLALNPFSVPALAAGALAALNLAWVFARLPETLPPERRGGAQRAHPLLPRPGSLGLPGIARTNWINLLYLTAFSAMEFSLTFLARERFGFGPRQNGLMFVYIGLVVAVVQGGLVRRLTPRHGERRVAITGFLLLFPGFLAVGLARSTGTLYAGLFFLAVGSALVMPCLSALVSRYAPEDRQGLALGTFRSMGALSRALGPLLGGLLYWRLGSTAPYVGGAFVLCVPLWLALGLPPVPDAAESP